VATAAAGSGRGHAFRNREAKRHVQRAAIRLPPVLSANGKIQPLGGLSENRKKTWAVVPYEHNWFIVLCYGRWSCR